MSTPVARHALSQANNVENIGTLAFAHKDAPLMEKGHEQAKDLGILLPERYGITPSLTPIATSELARTQQTASSAGFVALQSYAQLNEVLHGMDGHELRAMLDRRKLPSAAIQAAEAVLANPPKEEFWISHGLLIAGMCAVTGVYQNERLIPRFCEVRVIPT